MNRRGCCICTNDPNCLIDKSDPAYVPSPVPFQPDWGFLEYAQRTLTEQQRNNQEIVNQRVKYMQAKTDKLKSDFQYVKSCVYIMSPTDESNFNNALASWEKKFTELSKKDPSLLFITEYEETVFQIDFWQDVIDDFLPIIKENKRKRLLGNHELTVGEARELSRTLNCAISDEDIHMKNFGGWNEGYFLIYDYKSNYELKKAQAFIDPESHDLIRIKFNGLERIVKYSAPKYGIYTTFTTNYEGTFIPIELVEFWRNFDNNYRSYHTCP